MNFDLEHMNYVAGEVEKKIVSESALKYGAEAIQHFSDVKTDCDNVADLIDQEFDMLDTLPPTFPLSILRQNLNGRMLWTVTITATDQQLASTLNSRAGRSLSRKHATLAALIRCYVIELQKGPVLNEAA